MRYSMVSAVVVVFGQSLLVFFHAVLDWPGPAANVTAVCISAVPSYLLNRYWVWNKRDPNRFWSEIVPFWSMALLGLGFSTALVAYAERRWGTTVAVSAANLTGFGTVWVVKFFVLNHVLFKG
ncbi:MAG: GtrA family protein, partial [Nocardioidaceae bacterium]